MMRGWEGFWADCGDGDGDGAQYCGDGVGLGLKKCARGGDGDELLSPRHSLVMITC
jgi:hypothetical protein